MNTVSDVLNKFGPHILQSSVVTSALVWLYSHIGSDQKAVRIVYSLPFFMTALIYFEAVRRGFQRRAILEYFSTRLIPYAIVGLGSYIVFVLALRKYSLFISVFLMWVFSVVVSYFLYTYTNV